MRVLDLFAGLHGWSQAFKDRGHDVRTLEINPKQPATYCMDIRDFAKNPRLFLGGWVPDVILASPPCQGFSTATMGKSWSMGHEHDSVLGERRPKTPRAAEGVELVQAALRVVRDLNPRWWWLENPRATLRKLPLMDGLPRVTVTYCQYGDPTMKPTDLWGHFPDTWKPKPVCSNGDPCHIRAPRGSRTGTQGGGRLLHPQMSNHNGPGDWPKGHDAALRGLIPTGLSLSVCLAVEAAIEDNAAAR